MGEDRYLDEASVLKSVVVSFNLEQKKYKIHGSDVEGAATRAEFRQFLHWLVSSAYQAGARQWGGISFVGGSIMGILIGFALGKGWWFFG